MMAGTFCSEVQQNDLSKPGWIWNWAVGRLNGDGTGRWNSRCTSDSVGSDLEDAFLSSLLAKVLHDFGQVSSVATRSHTFFPTMQWIFLRYAREYTSAMHRIGARVDHKVSMSVAERCCTLALSGDRLGQMKLWRPKVAENKKPYLIPLGVLRCLEACIVCFACL